MVNIKQGLINDIELIKKHYKENGQIFVKPIELWIKNDLNEVSDKISWLTYKAKNRDKIEIIKSHIKKLEKATGADIICNNMLWLINYER